MVVIFILHYIKINDIYTREDLSKYNSKSNNYDKGNNHMKGVEPTINKRLRRIFKNAGFDTYLINEFRTSKLCNCCHNELEPFLIRESKKPRDKKLNKKILINGLLCHQDIKPQCKIIHNRDKNAVQNMLYIIDILKLTGKRFLENYVF